MYYDLSEKNELKIGLQWEGYILSLHSLETLMVFSLQLFLLNLS